MVVKDSKRGGDGDVGDGEIKNRKNKKREKSCESIKTKGTK
jgi:hypothetical protein